MNTNGALFDSIESRDEIESDLQRLTKAIFGKSSAHADVALDSLKDINMVNLPHPENAPGRMIDLCRLFLLRGERSDLDRCLSLSTKLIQGLSPTDVFHHQGLLYKGAAQVGLGDLESGIWKINLALKEVATSPDGAVDRAVIFWVLTTAALFVHEINVARCLAEKWLIAAREGNLPRTAYRAERALRLLDLVSGEIKSIPPRDQHCSSEVPEEWNGAEGFLTLWTRRSKGQVDSRRQAYSEPFPLLFGLPLMPAKSSNDLAQVVEFRSLFTRRQQYANETDLNSLVVQDQELENYRKELLTWDLARPLGALEAVLKATRPDLYWNSVVSRVLGGHAADFLGTLRPTSTSPIERPEAVVLSMDIRNYTNMCQTMSPKAIYELTNPVFKIMNEELVKAGGTIMEFGGDSVIVVFQIQSGQSVGIMHILGLISRCYERLRIHNLLSGLAAGQPPIRFGVGLNKGPVAMGFLGGLERCHLAVVGQAVNVAVRLESKTKEKPGNIIMAHSCLESSPPNFWTSPLKVNFRIRDLTNIELKGAEPIHGYGICPLIPGPIDFVPMGFVANYEEDAVYVDTGNIDKIGVIDHHYLRDDSRKTPLQSACELLLKKNELLFGKTKKHIKDNERDKEMSVEFRLHDHPDMDCAATLYLAYELLGPSPRLTIMEKLAEYVGWIDQGHTPDYDKIASSLYGVFLAHQDLAVDFNRQASEQAKPSAPCDRVLLEAGLRVIDAAVYILEHNPSANLSNVFTFEPTWFAEEKRLINDDHRLYRLDRKSAEEFQARVRGYSGRAPGIWLNRPQSKFFKIWARNDPAAPGNNGYLVMAVDWSTSVTESKEKRFIISVPPESGYNLQGLGQLLERHETERRKEMKQERPTDNIRHPADNNNPWYPGWGHDFTIIDTPQIVGTVLTAEEILEIITNWEPDDIVSSHADGTDLTAEEVQETLNKL